MADVAVVMSMKWQCMVLGAVLFGLGLIGFLARRNLIVMFLSTEVMLQGVLVNLLGFNAVYSALCAQDCVLGAYYFTSSTFCNDTPSAVCSRR